MNDYSRNHDFSAKDGLTTGDPNKVIKGSEVDDEFDDLVTAVASKVDEPASPNTGDVLEWSGSAVVWGARNLPFTFPALAQNLYVRNGSTATTQARVTADEMLVFNSGNSGVLLSSVDVTADITASGANGLDTGTETSAWYHIFVIWNGSSTDSLLSLSSTAPTLPGGYTHWGYAGAVYNPADFITFNQVGSLAHTDERNRYNNSSHTTITSWDLSGIIPPNVGAGVFRVEVFDTASGSATHEMGPINDNTLLVYKTSATNGNTASDVIEVPIVTAQTVYSLVGAASNDGTLNGIGWRF